MQRDMTEMILRFLSDIFIEASRAKDWERPTYSANRR